MDVSTQTGSLGDQAAKAALYKKEKKSNTKYPLDRDNKLSSASAATSLKYASPRDLPSYPSKGLTDGGFSAGEAATLANANQKSFEYWKPDASSSASKAAILAKDYKAPPLWHPELSSAGSKAALLAAKDGGNVNIWKPEASTDGNSAAGLAMRNKNLSPSLDYGYTADGSRRALLAATGAMSGRKRAGSSPIVTSSYPDSANSTANALNAANVANKPSTRGNRSNLGRTDGLGSTSAITNMGREMYTSHPPVAPEVEEKNRQAGLRAAAVSMAKQMYDVQQKSMEQEAGIGRSDSHFAANRVHRRQSSMSSTDEVFQATPQYANLQEAAQKLAAERLAKIHDRDESAAYRDYYGTNVPLQSRLSMRGRPRRRASSDGQSDELRSKQIRSEMSVFNDKLAEIDSKKRQKDRDSLMAAAQRNVLARMHGMDEKVFAETGKASPAMMSEWEAKARARAEADSSARMVNHGKVNIGGGKYLDQSEVDAIAAARVQPTLDEITEKAKAHRARDEELRQEEEERKRFAAEKAQNEKERNNKSKEEWKRFKEEEKREERAKKEQEKVRKAEEKRLRDEEKRRSKTKPSAMVIEPVEESKEAAPTTSETPVLEPIPQLEPISAEETLEVRPSFEALSADEMREAETSIELKNDQDTSFPVPVIQSPTSDNTSAIIARVFSAPIDGTRDEADVTTVSEIDPPTIQVEPAAATDTEIETSPADSSMPAKPSDLVADHVAPPIHESTTTTSNSTTPISSSKKESKGLSSWLKNKLALGSSKASKPSSEKSEKLPESATDPRATVGNTALASDSPEHKNNLEEKGDDSDKAVALAGRQGSAASALQEPTMTNPEALSSNAAVDPSYQRSPSVSSLSDHNHDDDLYGSSDPVLARGRSTDLGRKARTSVGEEEGSNVEEFEEARDQFDPGHLPLPAFKAGGRVSDSPVRDSKFLEDL